MNEYWKRNLPVPYFSQRECTYQWQRIATSNDDYSNINLNAQQVMQGIEKRKYVVGESIGRPVSLAFGSCNIVSLCMILHYYGITGDSPDEMMWKFYEKFRPEWRRESYNPNASAPLYSQGPNRLEDGANLKAFVEKEYRLPSSYVSHKEGGNGITLDQAKDHIERGTPVWVSYGPLQTLNQRANGQTGQGHIAVIRGFTKDGDVILNDPYGDPADAVGQIKADTETIRGFFDYSIGNGENAVMKREHFDKLIYAQLNQALVIEYPHVWSFPVRAAADPARPFLFSTHDLTPGSEQPGARPAAEQRMEYRKTQMETMLMTEWIDKACYPVTGAGRWHDGIHINKRDGTPVYAAGPGRLVLAKAVERNAKNAHE